MPPSWNKGGVPTQDTCRGFDVPFVLARNETRPLETLATEQGPIKLPFGPVDDGGYDRKDYWYEAETPQHAAEIVAKLVHILSLQDSVRIGAR